MLLLESIPQDIKSERNYKPCAPEIFRWIVVSSYGVVLLCAVVWGVFLLRERQQNSVADKDQQRIEEVKKQIQEVRAKSAESQKTREKYDQWKSWLRENYMLSGFLAQLYKSLPTDTRLQEMSLKEDPTRSGMFLMRMRFFARGENAVPGTQEFEEKLMALGVEIQEQGQSVAEGGKAEINALLRLPPSFYPALNSTPAPTAPEGRIEK